MAMESFLFNIVITELADLYVRSLAHRIWRKGAAAEPKTKPREQQCRRLDFNQQGHCTICVEIIVTNRGQLMPGCGHMFHAVCLQALNGESNACPDCRR